MTHLMVKLVLCIATAAVSATSLAKIRIEIIPENPTHDEPVYARVTSEAGDYLASGNFQRLFSYVHHQDNGEIRIIASYGLVGVPPGGDPVDYIFYLGRLPLGNYSVAVATNDIDEPFASMPMNVELSPAWHPERNQNPLDHSGMWWDPEAPGTSMVLRMSPTSRDIGGGFYAYDPDGEPVWYALAPGYWHNAELDFYRVKAFRSTGSGFGEQYDPDAFEAEEVGYIDLHFIGIGALTARVVIEGIDREVTLERFDF